MEYLVAGFGGFLGTCLRYFFTSVLSETGWQEAMPLATLVANMVAAIMIGGFIGYERGAGLLPEYTRLFLITGMLGGLSTFSAFSLQTVMYFETRQYFSALTNIVLNNVLSFALVLLGMRLVKGIFR